MKRFVVDFTFEGIQYQADVTEAPRNEFHIFQHDEFIMKRYGHNQVLTKEEDGVLTFRFIGPHESEDWHFKTSLSDAIKKYLELNEINRY